MGASNINPAKTGAIATRRIDDLETLLRLVAYSETELRTLAPGCAVIAGLLRSALKQEVLIEATRQAMEGLRQGA
jgi:hypothetical protein